MEWEKGINVLSEAKVSAIGSIQRKSGRHKSKPTNNNNNNKKQNKILNTTKNKKANNNNGRGVAAWAQWPAHVKYKLENEIYAQAHWDYPPACGGKVAMRRKAIGNGEAEKDESDLYSMI